MDNHASATSPLVITTSTMSANTTSNTTTTAMTDSARITCSREQWLTHVEAIFHNNRVRSDLGKVNHVLASLDDDGIRVISDLLGPDTSYTVIKVRLLSKYTAPASAMFQELVHSEGLGDKTPSELLRQIYDMYPGQMSDAIIETLWRSKLPAPVRAVIAGHDGPLSSLAQRADRVWEAYEADARYDREIAEAHHAQNVSRVLPRRVERDSSAVTPEHTSLETRVQALEAAINSLSI